MAHESGVTPLGAASAAVDAHGHVPVPAAEESEDYDPMRLADAASALCSPSRMEGCVGASAARPEGIAALADRGPQAFVEDAAASLLGIERPYLLVDVEPRLRSRAELCVLAREELAKAAKAQWAADCEGGQEVLALPPLYDATSARAALRLAQEVDGECSDLIWQKRKELDPNLE